MTAPVRLTTDPDALATTVREASERTIRAHAHRLVAGRRDVLREMDDDARRAELLSLAERVAAGEPHADALVSAVLPYLTVVPNAAVGFDVLVSAVGERSGFVADPDEWQAAHGVAELSWESMDDSTLAAVDLALDDLLGVRS